MVGGVLKKCVLKVQQDEHGAGWVVWNNKRVYAEPNRAVMDAKVGLRS